MNDFVIATPTASVFANLSAFYSAVPSGAVHSVCFYLSNSVSRGSTMLFIEEYDISGHLDGSDTGPPVNTAHVGLTSAASSTTDLPSEIALALSFHADLTGIPEHSGGLRPRASRRGRIYLGPFCNMGVVTDPVTGRTSVPTQMQTDIKQAAHALRVAEPGWCVWSRKLADAFPVVGGWVDDAWDTQRRRGEDPISRSLWA
jgi:hypothetical protein